MLFCLSFDSHLAAETKLVTAISLIWAAPNIQNIHKKHLGLIWTPIAVCVMNRVLSSTCFLFFFLPGVSLAGKDSLHESLGWHPLDRQHGTTAFPVIAGSGKREMESDDEDWREIHHLENRLKKYIKLVPTCRCLEPFQSLQSWPLFPVQDRWADNFGQRCLWRNTHTSVKWCKFRRHVQKTPMNKPIVHSIISKIWS